MYMQLELGGNLMLYQGRPYYRDKNAEKFMQGSKCTKIEMNIYYMYDVRNGDINLSEKDPV